MDKSVLAVTNGLSPLLGFATMIGLGAFLLILSFIIKTALVRNTHDFIIADRKVGFGFGVGSVIAVWTWAMAVMMSSAMTYQWGLSGLFWFVVPNGFAVIAMIPFARILRRNMPQGYTISEFVKYRFAQSKVASGIVTLTMIFGILLEILINLKGTSVVISTVFSIDWKVAAIVGIICVLTYSYFGGLWTSVMTGTLNTLMVTVPAAIVVAAVYEHVHGGAPAVFDAVGGGGPAQSFGAASRRGGGFRHYAGLRPSRGNRRRPDVLAESVGDPRPGSLAHVLLGRRPVLSDPNLPRHARPGRHRLWAEAGRHWRRHRRHRTLCGLAHRSATGAGGAFYVLSILAACYSTIDGASAALSSVVAVDIVKRYWPATKEGRLFVITKFSMLLGGAVATVIVLSGVDFTTLVLTTYALKTSILLPLVLAILWPRTNTVGFVGGVTLAILIGMPIYETQGELIGTLSIVAISGITVVIAGFAGSAKFDIASLRRVSDDIATDEPAVVAQPAE
ncbi:MAG: sodium:solute symporter [Xanthobacteraceae bacterium]